MLDKVEIYSKLLLVLSNDNPEIREKCEELSNIIHSIDWDFPIICSFINSLNYCFWKISDESLLGFFTAMAYQSYGEALLYYLIYCFFTTLDYITSLIYDILGCNTISIVWFLNIIRE